MSSIPKYIENKNNPDKIVYLDERLRPILEMTYGCLVYQEQVMQIAREIAGYSYGRADILRRIMSKKKAKLMDEQRKIFFNGSPANPKKKLTAVEGALARGASEAVVTKLFETVHIRAHTTVFISGPVRSPVNSAKNMYSQLCSGIGLDSSLTRFSP